MTAKKIGILTCSNMTSVLDCPVGACLKDLRDGRGSFADYAGDRVELVGTTSCNGCPTLAAPETILPKVEALIHYDATHIHMSYCMLVLCPYVKKYATAIRKRFPDAMLVMGTHEAHQTDQEFRSDVEAKLFERRKCIVP